MTKTRCCLITLLLGKFIKFPSLTLCSSQPQYNVDQNSEAFQDFTSVPSLDRKNSSDYNMMQFAPKKSFTEYSLKDGLGTNASRTMFPFMGGFNRGQDYAESNFSYGQSRQDNVNQRTPMFTGNSSGQNVFFARQIPPLSFDRINEFNEMDPSQEVNNGNYFLA